MKVLAVTVSFLSTDAVLCAVLCWLIQRAPHRTGGGDTVPTPRVTDGAQGDEWLEQDWNPGCLRPHLAHCLWAPWVFCQHLFSLLHLENVPSGALPTVLPLQGRPGGGWVGREDLFRVFTGGCL